MNRIRKATLDFAFGGDQDFFLARGIRQSLLLIEKTFSINKFYKY
jgi:hypothetical protein